MKKNALIFLGFLLFSVYFWNRFLRSRISKTLPLNLSIIKFFTLSYICLIFLFIVISLLFPRKANILVEQIIDWLFTPVAEFDNYLKSISMIKKYYIIILNFLFPILEYLIIKTNLFFIIFWIFPRIIMLLALFIDVFIFHQLHYKYYVILFGLLLFFNRYIKYSLKNYKKQLIEENKCYIFNITTPYVFGIHPAELAPDYDPNDPDEQDIDETMSLPFEIFINFQIKSMVYENKTRTIERIWTSTQLSEELWEKYIKEPYKYYSNVKRDLPLNYTNIFGSIRPDNYFKAREFIWKKEDEFTKIIMKNIMQVSLIVEYYSNTSNNNTQFKNIKILIYTNYLLCWLYVFIVSLETLDIYELLIVMNNTWISVMEPFTEISI